ncbi:MAG: hypothetical protein BZ133_08205 [Methanosphaera sp. SHI613]|jgi:hypothetical protein|nr:MAG: hypothetical protein BZ133_08205 [Methanosphaera sp. SHI613]
MTLNIGVIVHGPGIIDSGCAVKIINMLSTMGNVSCRLGGTMGRTAVIDASLENIIDISKKLLPSQSIKLMAQDNDILFLLNYGKSQVTGHTFGYKVYTNSNTNAKMIQIERPAEDDGVIISWSDKIDEEFLEELSERLNLPVISSDVAEKLAIGESSINDDESIIKRKVAGVSPGENIMMNGVIIGRVTGDELIIMAEDDRIIAMDGGIIKEHGLEKLGQVDLKKAIIKTGLLRKSENVTPRIIRHDDEDDLTAVYLDHAAEDIYKYRNNSIIVSVGDDTTLLSSDILYRFERPVIGITDGDLDKVVQKAFKMENSLIIQVESGWDDIVGKKIFDDIFNQQQIMTIDSIDSLKNEILALISQLDIEYHIVDNQLDKKFK